MGGEGPSVVLKWLSTFMLLLNVVLGVPRSHSLVMLLTIVA